MNYVCSNYCYYNMYRLWFELVPYWLTLITGKTIVLYPVLRINQKMNTHTHTLTASQNVFVHLFWQAEFILSCSVIVFVVTSVLAIYDNTSVRLVTLKSKCAIDYFVRLVLPVAIFTETTVCSFRANYWVYRLAERELARVYCSASLSEARLLH